MNMSIVESIGFIAAICTTSAFLPQAIKSYISGRTKDLSWTLLILQDTGNFLWIIYGFSIHSVPVYIANIITFALVGYLIVLKIIHNKASTESPI